MTDSAADPQPPPTDGALSSPTPDRWRLAWLLLPVAYLLIGGLFTVIQPAGALPDESAHMQYVRFLLDERRFPIWEPHGGGEAGYEAQHPPLSYLLQAIPFGLSAGMEEVMRWHLVRWLMLALGLALLPLTRRIGALLYPKEPSAQLTLTGTVLLMPLCLLYLGHANPDGICLILATCLLLLALRLLVKTRPGPWLPVAAGAVAGLAILTKISAGPAGLLPLAALLARRDLGRSRFGAMALCAAAWAGVGGWWYVRSRLLYGQFFVHTEGKFGSGLAIAERDGILDTAQQTLRETYLTTWIQRGWLPYGFDGFCYYFIGALLIVALIGLFRRGHGFRSPEPALRFATLASAGLIAAILAGQQAAFWTVDLELNAGGRYVMVGMAGIGVLLSAGWRAWGARVAAILCVVWLLLLLSMSVVAAQHIVDELNPRFYPGWRMFEFPRAPGA